MRRLVLCVTGTVLFFLLGASLAWARSYTFPSVEVEARVLADGSLQVVEHRTVRFSGAYHAFDQWIPTGGTAGITDVLVSEAGRPYRKVRQGVPA